MQRNNHRANKNPSVWNNPRLRLFFKLFLNVTIPMIILIFTLPYSKWGILLAFLTSGILTLFLVNGIMHEASMHLLTLSQWISEVSSGSMETREIHTSNKTIQGLFISFQTLMNQLIQLREVCLAISQGDFSKFFSTSPPLGSMGDAVEKLRQKVKESGLIAERHLTFLNNVPVPIITLTRSLEIDYMNYAAEKMFQEPVSKCLGMKCKNLMNTDQCKSGQCKAYRVIENDMPLTTITNVYINNTSIPVRYTNLPIHDANNQVIGIMKFIMNISNEMKLVNLAEKISKGDYSVTIDAHTEDKRLINAFNQMTQTLRRATEENANQNWIKTGQTELNVRLRGEQDIQTLAEGIIFFLCDYLNAPVGTFYIEKDTKYRLVASYAYSNRKALNNVFEQGEGLIGQAALEKKMIIFNELPHNYIYMQSGLGKEHPEAFAVVPLTYQDLVLGVMELGSVKAFTKVQLDFINIISENIAVAINTSKARTRMSSLLAHSQNQSEELKVQQEELRQAYDDLEEQTKKLQKSEANLQQQHEELSQSNKALEKQAQLLEKQKEAISKKNETFEAQQEVIEQKARDLERANQYKSEFLANMSHELRTPLNSILLLSGIIAEDREKNLTDKQKEFANTINLCGTDLLNLINEVLDLSKVESGKMELYPEHFNLQDIVSSLKKTFEPVANQRKLEFKTSILSNLPAQMFTDQLRLEQILKNILSNAFKFTQEGKVSLTIQRPDEPHCSYNKYTFDIDDLILFEIEDTGIGIPEDKQDNIFEAFHQGDGTTKRRYGGTGLGLSIVKKMVYLLGGNVYLESQLGKGSKFCVVVPEKLPKDWPQVIVSFSSDPQEFRPQIEMLESKPDTIMADNAITSVETSSEPLMHEKPATEVKILIVSNNHKIAEHVQSIAEKQKFVPEIVKSSKLAIENCNQSIPSGIILDLGLPAWTCWFMYIQLQKTKELAEIPVHWVSGLHLDTSDQNMRMFFLKNDRTGKSFQSVIKSMNLLCDDDIQNALIIRKEDSALRQQLETNFHLSCIHLSDILEASTYIETHTIRLIILDTSYQAIKNIQHIDQLAQNANQAKIPTLFITDADIWEQEWIIPVMDQDGEIQQQKFNVMERITDETLLFFHRLKQVNRNEQAQLMHNKDKILVGKKFLLVDDDMRNVFAITSVLEARGSKVVVGRNGKEGMKCLSDHSDIDLILMDIMMPEMNGYDAIKRIREKPGYQKVPIIALTAKAMKKDRDKCIQAGADDYMSKPVYPDKLISMLRLWLNR